MLGAFFAYPSFIRRFGEIDPATGLHFLSAKWQTALWTGTSVGQVIGLLINGILCEWIGYRKTMMASLAALCGFLFFPCVFTIFRTSLKLIYHTASSLPM